MRLTTSWACAALHIITLLSTSTLVSAAEDPKPSQKPVKPCAVRSSTSGSYFDLNSLYITPPEKKDKDAKKNDDDDDDDKDKKAAHHSYQINGWDYGHNFTLNFCGPVVEELDDVEDVSKSMWKNVSAYYTVGRRTYSMGQESSDLVLRGRKLVLNYTGGSYCDSSTSKRSLPSNKAQDLRPTKLIDDDDDDDDDKKKDDKKKHHDDDDDDDDDKKRKGKSDGRRRKSTIISLLCDKEPPAAGAPLATVAFVGASEDECTYFFEARSQAACATAETSTQGALGPGGVFGVILLIALMVYLIGGCVYQRTVLNQRGWRQIPNYSLWMGMFSFIADMFVILTSSCTRFLPWRKGYSRITLNGNSSSGRGRDRDSDAENRLIDQLDEEWDD